MKKSIWVANGAVHYDGYINCTISNNGYVETGILGEFKHRYYGLVSYLCDDVTGHLISRMSCHKCGVFCTENEMIEGCQQLMLPAIVGLTLGSLLTVITSLLWMKILKPRLTVLYDRCAKHLQKKRAEKSEAKIEAIKQRLNPSVYPSLSPILIIFVGFVLAAVGACDNTLYITSTGLICDNTHCIKSEMYDLTLESGSTLCFKDKSDEIVKIRLSASYRMARSMLIYRTGSFDLGVSQTWECKGSGKCWNGECNHGTKHPALLAKQSNNSIMGYGCGSDTIGCDTWCWHQTSCTFYRWTLSSRGETYPVYKTVSRFWNVIIELSYRNVTKLVTLNVNNPRFDLDTVDENKIPILVNGFSSQEDVYEKFYIKASGSFYNIDASNQNMPETDKVGDLQIATDGKSILYNSHNVRCYAQSCRAICITPEPKMDRFLNGIERYMPQEGNFINDETVLLTKHRVNGVVKMMIGNVDIASLKVSSAKCKIEAIGTYSCSGCSNKAYVILQASEIKEQGLIPYSSNCTFSSVMASCNPDPYKMELTSYSKHCKISFNSINSSVIASFEFNYLGHLDPSREIYSYGEDVDTYLNIIKNKTTLDSLLYSWLGMSVIGILSSYIIRVGRMVIACWLIRKVKNETVIEATTDNKLNV